MSIKDIGSFQSTLNRADSQGWSQNVDQNFKDFKINTPGLEGEIKGDLENSFDESISGRKSFGEFLTDSLSKVNDLQQDANIAMEKLASGESDNLHETLLAVEKAEISFKMMNQVRSKVLDAYRDIMKMQI